MTLHNRIMDKWRQRIKAETIAHQERCDVQLVYDVIALARAQKDPRATERFFGTPLTKRGHARHQNGLQIAKASMKIAADNIAAADQLTDQSSWVKIEDLEPHHCRWVVAEVDGEALYCGQRRDPPGWAKITRYYCAHHSDVAATHRGNYSEKYITHLAEKDSSDDKQSETD